MQSFRTELENPVVEKDILELEKKIRLFRKGKIDEEKFRSLRLARGVYGQRQPGVQMVRIKIPFGRLSAGQLTRIADISDEYASRTLHATTRQDIQIHYVSLEKTPELWAKLEESQITLREACGNTVRNITASDKAGIDPHEPFDVSPYAYEMFRYFLRNPVCQEMGRKFKIAFSSSEQDSAFTFIHDIGLIPKIITENGTEKRGFKVVIGGGLGAIPYLAQVAYEFLEEDLIIPFTEAVLRVFDRYGERARRHKARFKFLLDDLGLEGVMDLVRQEWKALPNQHYALSGEVLPEAQPLPENYIYPEVIIQDEKKYQDWQRTNVFAQKQAGFYGVYVKVLLGNISSDTGRALAQIVKNHAADDIRVTVNQGYLLRFVREAALPSLFAQLNTLGLAEPGFDSTGDITACPGTDTCNLGISSSTGIARELEKVIKTEYPELIFDSQIKIKISGCPNACGQHGIATIGFHGSSLKNGKLVLP
ncbi:MAG: nitrite/sulfite reductase, partial [Bacteroidia bacterium]|nr:nitrite/sulfite reductase [Bacteroidia bacterium]